MVSEYHNQTTQVRRVFSGVSVLRKKNASQLKTTSNFSSHTGRGEIIATSTIFISSNTTICCVFVVHWRSVCFV